MRNETLRIPREAGPIPGHIDVRHIQRLFYAPFYHASSLIYAYSTHHSTQLIRGSVSLFSFLAALLTHRFAGHLKSYEKDGQRTPLEIASVRNADRLHRNPHAVFPHPQISHQPSAHPFVSHSGEKAICLSGSSPRPHCPRCSSVAVPARVKTLVGIG